MLYHIPALLKQCIGGLNIRSEGIYVDVTFGGGGHSQRLLQYLGDNGHLFGFDQDADAERNSLADRRFTFVGSNFRYLETFLDWYGVQMVDGIIADLGVSFHHFDDMMRGFSFRFEGNLDMRMNNRAGITAIDILNTYSEEALADMLYHYGELRHSRTIAKTIVSARNVRQIRTVQEFVAVLKSCFNREKEKKQMAQTFQAFRIEVNDEMDALKEMLEQARRLLKSGGRMAVITYHSLEDRIVKNFFRTGNFDGIIIRDFYGNIQSPFRPVNRKVITPDKDEIEWNPRSHSAKLRIVEKI